MHMFSCQAESNNTIIISAKELVSDEHKQEPPAPTLIPSGSWRGKKVR